MHAETGKVEVLTDVEGVRVRFIASHRDFPESLYIGLNNRDPRFDQSGSGGWLCPFTQGVRSCWTGDPSLLSVKCTDLFMGR